MKEKFFMVYKTENIINGNIYIGIHSTYDINDGYLGSGSIILNAIKKYGKNNFKRTILKLCSSMKEAQEMEAVLVNENFIKRDDTYNIVVGGGVPPKNEEYEKIRIQAVSKSTKQRVWIHNIDSKSHKRVLKQQINEWVDKGWKEGRICHWNTERNKKYPNKRDKNTGKFIKGEKKL